MTTAQNTGQEVKEKGAKAGKAARSLARPKTGGGLESPESMSGASRVKTIRVKYGFKQSQMSRLLGISARKLSELESQPKEPRLETKRRLTEVDRLRRAMSEIIDPDEIAAWMEEPNDAFDGSTPLQVVERGEIDRLWQMIYAVRTGHPL